MLKTISSAIRDANQRSRARHQYAMLLDLDDHLLRDIGMGRDEVRSRLAALPRA